jgi:hypothetical protein
MEPGQEGFDRPACTEPKMPKEGFKAAVEHHLTEKETEPWGIIYFKAY